MKLSLFALLVLVVGFTTLAGCGKKDPAYEQLTQPGSGLDKKTTTASQDESAKTGDASDTADDRTTEDQGSKDRRADARKSIGL